MIVGTDYLFIAVPKNASTSLRTAITLNPFTQCQDPWNGRFIKGIEDFTNSHVTLSRVAQHIDVSPLYKIAFVRNPWDRFVSYCAWTRTTYCERNSGEDAFGFKERPQKYMELVLRFSDKLKLNTTMIWRQHEFLTLNDQLAVDYIGRFENLQEDFDELCTNMGWKHVKLPTRNTGDHADYRTYYTPELVDAVGEYYKRDIELFGYTFE